MFQVEGSFGPVSVVLNTLSRPLSSLFKNKQHSRTEIWWQGSSVASTSRPVWTDAHASGEEPKTDPNFCVDVNALAGQFFRGRLSL